MIETLNDGKMTIGKLLQYLHQQAIQCIEKSDEQELNIISITLDTLYEAAAKHGDKELYLLLDDLNYILKEYLMGGRGKGYELFPSIEERIKKINAHGEN